MLFHNYCQDHLYYQADQKLNYKDFLILLKIDNASQLILDAKWFGPKAEEAKAIDQACLMSIGQNSAFLTEILS